MALSTIDTSSISGLGYGFKNRIINGGMVIDQRNAGALVAGAAGNIYGVDRFPTGAFGSATGRISAQQSSTVPVGAGFTKSLVNTVTTADASPSALYGYCIQQKIEGYNVADLMWGTADAKPVTLSFWVRSSIAGTYIATFSNLDPSDNPNRAYSATYTISAANTWEQKTITIAGDTTGSWNTTNGNGLFLVWGLGGGTSRQSPAVNVWGTGASVYVVTDAPGCVDWIATSGATFYITGVQLEKGTVATSFDWRPYGTELALCQRYYQSWRGGAYTRFGSGFVANTTTVYAITVAPKVTFRSVPTLSATNCYVNDTTGNYLVSALNNLSAADAICFDATAATGMTINRPAFFGDSGPATAVFTASAEL
jgi:hypothetical protein